MPEKQINEIRSRLARLERAAEELAADSSLCNSMLAVDLDHEIIQNYKLLEKLEIKEYEAQNFQHRALLRKRMAGNQ